MTWAVTNIPLESIEEMWPLASRLLVPAIIYSGGRTDLPAVYEGLQARRYLLWVTYPESDRTIRAVFITRVATYARRSMLSIDLCAGRSMVDWLATASECFRQFAADSGLDGVELYGRKGWTRVLRRYGWHDSLVLCEIDVQEQGHVEDR